MSAGIDKVEGAFAHGLEHVDERSILGSPV